MSILRTKRLELRELSVADDEFILELLNEPGFLRHIGDKGVRTLSDAREYITTAWWPITMPGVAIVLVCLAANLTGDCVRDRLDPRLRQL